MATACETRQEIEFPEVQYPISDARAAEYYDTVHRGREIMARSRIVMCGLARNVAETLPLTIARLERLGEMFADHRVFFYENDSTDDTPRQIAAWAQRDQRVAFASETCGRPRHASIRSLTRAADMADYRNRCQREVAARWAGFDYVCVVDTDLPDGWSLDGIAHSFGSQPWDFVGSNGIIYQRHRLSLRALHFDVWAYRDHGNYHPLDCHVGNALSWSRGEPLVPVYSCFGGLGLYRMPAWLSARYEGDDCEHVTLHRGMRAAGYDRQFLNPSQLVLYGRKERRFDALMLGLGSVMNAVVGVFAV